MKRPVEESDFIPCDILDIVRSIRADNPAAAGRFIDAFKLPALSLRFLRLNLHSDAEIRTGANGENGERLSSRQDFFRRLAN